MIESRFESVYTTYNKSRAMKVMARMKDNGVGFVYKTTAETASDDVLHEIRVDEKDFSQAQDIIIGLENSEKE